MNHVTPDLPARSRGSFRSADPGPDPPGHFRAPPAARREAHRGPPRHLFGERTVVRQALARLAQDGIIEQRPNRGAYVTAPTRDEARHVLAARAVVEPEVSRSVACGCSAAGLPAAPSSGDRRRGARGGRCRHAGAAHRQFHVAMAEEAETRSSCGC